MSRPAIQVPTFQFSKAPELCRNELLHELFERSAAAEEGQIALACGEERMTYGEVEQRANQLARHLRALAALRGSHVALLLPRSMDVYVTLLAALKAGAAYVPLDPDYPADRVEFILADVNADVLVTVSALRQKAGKFAGRIVVLDRDAEAISRQPTTQLLRRETGTTPQDIAYVIYTSGTTGRPKGVEIQHRSACHLVRAEGAIFDVRPDDRVYQGFSIAFDASVEEVWLAFFAGATLVAGTREMVHSGPMLSRLLTEAGVTVFSTVPTQLAMMTDDVPTVSLLIVGGEACPADLVNRWARGNRRMVNTYGPTEATVIATYGDLRPGEPVTIGRPVPNYFVFILDELRRPLPPGEVGELCIGGLGLARGYVGRPDLTAEKFIPNPLGAEPPRLYRTGDLACFNEDGELEFRGRIDSQVKLRGYRIELSEIESVLLACPGVAAAVATVREDVPGVQQLVAYVVPRDEAGVAEQDLKELLRARLPGYMVHAVIEPIPSLPTLPSGKVDRRALPAPRPREATLADPNHVAPRTAMERKLATVWEKLFAPQRVSVTDDFFRELGGHSLLAARLVSELRQDPELRGVSILDVYEQPTVEKLAARLEPGRPPPGVADDAGRASTAASTKAEDDVGVRAPGAAGSNLRHFLCGLWQLGGLYFVLGFFSLQWLAPYLTYTWMYEEDYERWEAIVGAFGVLVALYPAMLAASIAIKWLVIGRYRAGAHPLWGGYYVRFWFVNTIQSAIPVHYLAGTPLLNVYFRLMGARIGRNVHLASPNFACYDLLDIGDDTSVGTDATAPGYHVEDGQLIIGSVRIGKGCFIGTRAVMRENSSLADGAALEDMSLLPAGKTIPAVERWLGSPAKRSTEHRPAGAGESAKAEPCSALHRLGFACLHAIGVALFPACILAAILPGVVLMNHFNYEDDYYGYLLLAPLVAFSYVVLLGLEIAAFKWLLLGRVRPGRYPIHSWFYVRKWFVDHLMDLSLDFLGPLYASVYLEPWFKLLGAKLGKQAEISTAGAVSPDLLDLGDECFLADSVTLGAARVEGGFITLAECRVGKRAFVGNSAMLPPGSGVADNALVGCLSLPPSKPEDAARPGATWLGSPAIFLPSRQQSTAFAVENTFKPTTKLRALRALIEFIRVLLPASGFVVLTSLLFSGVVLTQDYLEPWEHLAIFPLLYGVCGLLAVLFLVALKWTVVGRYRPGERPLWSTFVWRNELVNAVHEHLSNDWFVGILQGTPFLCWVFRALGARIGRRVYLETTDITEHDLVRLGDDVCVNADATLQTHLFEDRVMKMSTVDIGDRCTIGGLSLVLYDTRMEPDARLNSLSLLMKGETLPAGTNWEGIPARTTNG
ncbi:MAG: Pls/PosA family non-ribosomal peptide synthetase [Limisphaerales bacterium]